MNTVATLDSLRSHRHRRGSLRLRRNELKNLARRAGYDLSWHWANWSGGFRLLRLTGRPQRGAFAGPGRLAGLDFCPTETHTATERAFVYLHARLSRSARKVQAV